MLRITKFVHACLLVETDNLTAIFDPGNYSFEANVFDISKLAKLDYLFVTHEHADHFAQSFVEVLVSKFPNTRIISTTPVVETLKSISQNTTTESGDDYQLFTAPHEKIPTGEAPLNTGVHFANVLSHPGDSHSFSETKAILAMPMTAPWGSMYNAVQKISELRPKVVIPIHDWHWRPEALAGMYTRLKEKLKIQNIDFVIPEDGKAIEISVE
jgi:L-ascorbate metabolism protein UlaG (beta-lactamase superfamily)